MSNSEKIHEIEAKLLAMEEILRDREQVSLYTLALGGHGAVSDHLNRTRIANEARREVTADLVRAYRAEIAALRARVKALERGRVVVG